MTKMLDMDELDKCVSTARNDIRGYRKRKNMTYGQDPAMPYLDQLLNPWGQMDRKTASCYLLSNLGTWSATKATGKTKKSLTGSDLAMFEKKDVTIKSCKKLFKDLCAGKIL